MPKKLVFDTLNYAKMLKNGGVKCSNTHSSALSKVIAHNIYTKNEVDKMIDAALRRVDESLRKFDERTRNMEKEFAKEMHRRDLKSEEIKHEMISHLTRNIGIIVTLLTLVSSILHFIS